MTAREIHLETTDWIEFHPVIWQPTSKEEKLAALIAYMTGDGTMTKRSGKYKKTNGEISHYEKTLTGGFYSNILTDLENISADCKSIGIGLNASVTLKKNIEGRDNGYQFQIGKSDCEILVSHGCPSGKKTTIEFDVPKWILSGSANIKRAYLGALFGAEGNIPTKDKTSKSRFPRQPIMTMCKIDGVASGETYFEQLKEIMTSLGVESTIGFNLTEAFGKTYRTNWIRVASGADNLTRFFNNVGFVYCRQKSIEGWKWSKYLKTYQAKANHRKATVSKMKEEGCTYSEIGKILGITRGAVWRLESDIKAGKSVTPGRSFEHYDNWIKDRWLEKEQLLRLEVVGRKFHEDRQVVWNVNVSSPDHSYLLASGANNFNSFETMAGRVYYPFERKEHVGSYKFDPRLPIWIGMDFNIDPMSAVILQPQANGELWAVDEVVLFGSNTEQMSSSLDKKFWREQKQITLYPDPAAGQRQHARGETDLDILREGGFKKIKYRRKNPLIVDRVNAVNRLLRTASGNIRLRIDGKCKHLIDALEQTIYKKGSKEVDKDAGTEHSADALGYPIELEYPVRKVEVAGLSL